MRVENGRRRNTVDPVAGREQIHRRRAESELQCVLDPLLRLDAEGVGRIRNDLERHQPNRCRMSREPRHHRDRPDQATIDDPTLGQLTVHINPDGQIDQVDR